MTVLSYAAMWVAVATLACFLDTYVWLGRVRPLLAKRFGWPPVRDDERIPPAAAAIGGVATFILLFVVPLVGVSAGY